ncbi:hypothetical protein C8R44DRAFT_329964 [Mycena epipterygia]|nr:hypothetical protein C8R44DRAFT_329964 [Mycena epipterygia]
MSSLLSTFLYQAFVIGRSTPIEKGDVVQEIEVTNGIIHVVRYHYTRQDVIGLGAGCILAIISTLTCAGLLAYLAFHVTRKNNQLSSNMRAFLSSDLGAYFMCLLVTNFITSLGYATNTRSLRTFVLQSGPMCDFQGVTKASGILGGSFWNSCIATQTFFTVVMRMKTPRWVLPVVLSLGWGFMVIVAIIGPLQHHVMGFGFSFYGPQSVGCYAAAGALRALDWFLALPIIALIALVMMLLLYIGTYMHILGVFRRNSNGNWSFFHKKSTTQDLSNASGSGPWSNHPPSEVTVSKQARAVAQKMLLFPVAYFLTSFLSILGALLNVSGVLASSQILDNVGFALLASSGWIDVLLFVVTRNSLLIRRSVNTTTNARSQIHVTTHQTTFLDLDAAYELQQRSAAASGKSGAEHESFDAPTKTVDNVEADPAVFRVKVFDG